MLIAAAERIRRCVRPTDLAARLGGDEFAVLLEDADERRGEEIAHRIVALLVARPSTIAGQPCWVRASIGIASARRRLGHRRRRPDAPRRHRDVPREGGGQGPGARVHAGHAPERADQGAVARRAPRRARRRRVRRPLPADRGGRHGRGRRRRGARALEPPAPRAALARRVRAGGRGDRDDPGIDRVVLEQACRAAAAWTAGGRLRARRGRAREPERRGAADDRARRRRRGRARAAPGSRRTGSCSS